ncbi:hypothetical protein V202x_09950 [Gimesia aquarii]|uniref:Uncharacterized protein n=1 Tax=Gimesia aquarii TaxID=2527964 RepID=A0A517WQU9_9PLAN|nr:hypothetical protein V202x_09950 [Gimesia aquarii]
MNYEVKELLGFASKMTVVQSAPHMGILKVRNMS